MNSNLSSLTRLNKRFFLTSDPLSLTNSFKPAKKLLTDNSDEIVNILLEVVFDNEGRIQIDKLESLLNTLFKDTENINADLIPVANAGLKLFTSNKGSEVRKNLLLSLVKDDRLEFKDLEKLLNLLRDTFSPLKLAKSAVQNIISPA